MKQQHTPTNQERDIFMQAKQFNYWFSAAGWAGFCGSLIVAILMGKCKGDQPIVEKQTIVHNYYDSGYRLVRVKSVIPGDTIKVPVPANIDTAKILELYFSKFAYSRVWQDSCIRATLVDTVSQNRFIGSAFQYQWLKPVKTVEQTTITISPPQKLQLFIGAYLQAGNNQVKGYGPELYLMTKKGQLFGVNYDLKNQSIGGKAAININDAFRTKNKR